MEDSSSSPLCSLGPSDPPLCQPSKRQFQNLPCLCLPGEPCGALLHCKELPQRLLTLQSWAAPSIHASPHESSATIGGSPRTPQQHQHQAGAVSGDPSPRETKAADPLMDWHLPFPPSTAPQPCPGLTASGTATQSLPTPKAQSPETRCLFLSSGHPRRAWAGSQIPWTLIRACCGSCGCWW